MDDAKRELRKKHELERRFQKDGEDGVASDDSDAEEDEDKIREAEEAGEGSCDSVAMAACLFCWRIVLVSKFPTIHSRLALGSEEVWQYGQQLTLQSDAKLCPYACPGFGKLEKRVRTAGGGASGSVRNLRIREDTAKYLLNLDPSSAHYDPKSRSMREDPLPYKVCPSPP